jgi:hypothetical protein
VSGSVCAAPDAKVLRHIFNPPQAARYGRYSQRRDRRYIAIGARDVVCRDNILGMNFGADKSIR